MAGALAGAASCGHADESPSWCPCPEGCHCRTRTCLGRDLGLRQMQRDAHAYAKGNGFWDPETNPTFEGKLMLTVSELSEALEAFRDGQVENEVRADGKPEGVPSELADAVIRIGDLAEKMGVDLAAAVRQKMHFNKSRPFRHGRKL